MNKNTLATRNYFAFRFSNDKSRNSRRRVEGWLGYRFPSGERKRRSVRAIAKSYNAQNLTIVAVRFRDKTL